MTQILISFACYEDSTALSYEGIRRQGLVSDAFSWSKRFSEAESSEGGADKETLLFRVRKLVKQKTESLL